MTETDLGIGTIILALAVLSLIDFFIVTASVWAASRLFKYSNKDRGSAAKIAIYSLKVGLIVAAPFAFALYVTQPTPGDILAKGPRLLLPIGLVFLVKTSAFFLEMKKVYSESMKKTMNGYATAVYLIICSWVLVIIISSILIGFYGTLSIMSGTEGESVDEPLTGWWDLQPDLPGNFSASTSEYSLTVRNGMDEPIKIDSALVVDIESEEPCNIASPEASQEVGVNATFTLKATCPITNISLGDPYDLGLEIYYMTLNTPVAPRVENGYASGIASA
jgi:hypothetical protein